eukprot:2004475-Rhodomonas_salina.1
MPCTDNARMALPGPAGGRGPPPGGMGPLGAMGGFGGPGMGTGLGMGALPTPQVCGPRLRVGFVLLFMEGLLRFKGAVLRFKGAVLPFMEARLTREGAVQSLGLPPDTP